MVHTEMARPKPDVIVELEFLGKDKRKKRSKCCIDVASEINSNTRTP
ncbi:MAG: hypothetical protein WB988_25245 [Candidatus Nitrosopolaris sp.]